jgi:hypothetical protein
MTGGIIVRAHEVVSEFIPDFVSSIAFIFRFG